MIKLTKYHLDTLREVSNRIAILANSLSDNLISFSVSLSTRPYSITVFVYEWSDDAPNAPIVESDAFNWYFDRDPEEAEQKRLELLSKVSEWEEKYGL